MKYYVNLRDDSWTVLIPDTCGRDPCRQTWHSQSRPHHPKALSELRRARGFRPRPRKLRSAENRAAQARASNSGQRPSGSVLRL
jgi:hypothetical protein